MELEQLRLFIAVSEHGSMSAAARALYLSHSTLSRAVSSLEQELGVTLMHRSHHSLSLTPAGQALAQDGKKLLAQAEEIMVRVRGIGE